MENFTPEISLNLDQENAQLKAQLERQNLRIAELEKALQEANQLTTIDSLTGIDNRRSIDENLPIEIAGAARKNGKLIVIMIDIDHFKDLNDTYGHPWGDNVLKAVANSLNSSKRANDFVGRYGGEEFTLILQEEGDTDLSNFNTDRFQEAVRKINRSPNGDANPLTISLGAVILDFSKTNREHNLVSAEKTIKAADINLYQSKKSGRNKLTLSEYSEPVPVS